MTQQPEIPEGWERRGEFLFRQHDGSFATIWQDGDSDWAATVATLGDSAASESWEATLPATVAWANSQLGVPKPVEVVEEVFADGSRIIKDKDNTRWATVCKFGIRWYVGMNTDQKGFTDESDAIESAREYVRCAQ